MNHHTPKFCSNCGQSLHAGARFCGNCGARVAASVAAPAATPALAAQVALATPVAPDPQPAARAVVQPAAGLEPPAGLEPQEPILHLIASVNRHKGLFGREPFFMVVTPRRLVFATITTEQTKWAAAQAKENARQQGKGFLKQWGAVITSVNFLADAYRAMPVQQILSHHADNFFIELGQIQQVKTKVNWDDESSSPDQMEIRYSGGKMKFDLAGCNAHAIRKAFKPLLGNRVK